MGSGVGSLDGLGVGIGVGEYEGSADGTDVEGVCVGPSLGFWLGVLVGSYVGTPGVLQCLPHHLQVGSAMMSSSRPSSVTHFTLHHSQSSIVPGFGTQSIGGSFK